MLSLCNKWRKFAKSPDATLDNMLVGSLAPDFDEAELLPVLSSKLPFF